MPRQQQIVLSEDEKAKLITLIQLKKPIWYKRDSNYRNCYVTEKLWDDISICMGVDKKLLQAIWKNLITKMRAEVASVPKMSSGSEAINYKSNWVHFTQIKFFIEEILCGETSGNLDALDKLYSLPQEGSNDKQLPVLALPVSSVTSSPIIIPQSNKSSTELSLHQNTKNTTDLNGDSEYYDYFASLVPFIMQISNDQDQMCFREDMYDVLMKFVGTFEDDV